MPCARNDFACIEWSRTEDRFPVEPPNGGERFPLDERTVAETLGRGETLPFWSKEELEECLYRNIYPLVLSISSKYDFRSEGAEDLAQECMKRIFMKIGQYNRKKGRLTTWVFRVSSNCLNKLYNKERRREFLVEMPESLNYDVGGGGVTNHKDATLYLDMQTVAGELVEKHPKYKSVLNALILSADGVDSGHIKVAEISRRTGVAPLQITRFIEKVVRPYFVKRFKYKGADNVNF
jgi:hypothetical protein